MDFPAQVAFLVASATAAGNKKKVCCYVVFEAVLADVAEEFLHLRYAHYSCSSEGQQRIVCEFALSYVTADDSFAVVRGEPCEAHSSRFDLAHAGPEGVVFAYSAGYDLLESPILTFFEKVLRQVAAVEADSFIRVFSVVVVPVEQGAGSLGREGKRVHANNSRDIDFAGALRAGCRSPSCS